MRRNTPIRRSRNQERASRLLLRDDVERIYRQHVSVNDTEEYRSRYVPLPLEMNTDKWRWEGHDFPRIVSLLEFDRFVREHGVSPEKLLCVNYVDDPEVEFVTAKMRIDVSYDEDPCRFDLHVFDIHNRGFDLVLVSQTLEHTYDPIRCLQNIRRVMRRGGLLYANVPVNNIPHSTPYHHYTGFTPTGLGCIAEAAGLEVVSIGQWGNQEYLLKLHSTGKWPDFTELENPGVNEFEHPAACWIWARS